MPTQNNISRHLMLILFICGFSLCTSCGNTGEPEQTEDNIPISNEMEVTDASPTTAVTDTPSVPSPPDMKESPQTEPVPSEVEELPPEPPVLESEESIEDEPLAGTPLTKEELQSYTELIQQGSNYGFLLSDWDKPTDVNLYEVFYNGAGIARDSTEAEIQAFLARHNQDELYTDFFVMDKAAVSSLLLEKIGLTYDEFVMKGGKGMDEIYYEESDSFCLEVGDTNYCMFECTDGVINEEGTIVTLHYKGDYFWIEEGEVQMWVDGSSFRSNHILKGDFLDTQN